MRKMSFTSRDTARAADILNMALEDQSCSTWLILAGSTGAGGCMHVYRDMVKYGMIDAIVATGASIVDMDFFEALGFKHYQAKADPGRQRRCARTTSTASTTPTSTRKSCRRATTRSTRSANTLEPRAYSSREFIYEMGKWLAAGNAKKKDSLIQTRLRRRRADLLPGVRRLLGRLRPGQAPGRAPQSRASPT